MVISLSTAVTEADFYDKLCKYNPLQDKLREFWYNTPFSQYIMHGLKHHVAPTGFRLQIMILLFKEKYIRIKIVNRVLIITVQLPWPGILLGSFHTISSNCPVTLWGSYYCLCFPVKKTKAHRCNLTMIRELVSNTVGIGTQFQLQNRKLSLYSKLPYVHYISKWSAQLCSQEKSSL